MTETFGNVVLEAMASGLVTVAYDYAAPHRFIEDGRNGFLAAYDKDEDFLSATNRAFDAMDHWPGIRRAARKTAEALGWDGIVRDFAEELQSVIDDGPR